MKEYFQNKYRIPTARATWHNYREGMYFITICTHQHKPYLGRIIPRPGLEENQLKLTEVGKFVMENLQQITCHYPYAKIPVFVIMPNHIHFIIIIDSSDDPTRRDVVRYVSDIPFKDPNGDVARNHSFDNPNGDVARNVSTGNNQNNRNQTISTDNENQTQKPISPQKGSLSTVIRGFKSAITKYARERGIAFAWQTRFYDRIVRNQNELNAIVEYIENNPYK